MRATAAIKTMVPRFAVDPELLIFYIIHCDNRSAYPSYWELPWSTRYDDCWCCLLFPHPSRKLLKS